MFNIKGYVEATFRDSEGNVIQYEEGHNTVVQMSSNIIMDNILPRLGASGTATGVSNRPEATNMDDDTAFPNGGNYIGPAGASTNTSAAHAINNIAYIAVGDNLGTDSAGNVHSSQNADVASASTQVNMVDDSFSLTSTNPYFARLVDSVSFPAYNQIRFTTTFALGEGNITNGIAEIGLWTAGDNVDADGFANTTTPTVTTNMRLFARKVLDNTITKTDDGTLEINYTITFNA
jgi:hypothetical protein